MNIEKARSGIANYLEKTDLFYYDVAEQHFFKVIYSNEKGLDYYLTIAYSEEGMLLTVKLDDLRRDSLDMDLLGRKINAINCILKSGCFSILEGSNIVFYKEYINYAWMKNLDRHMVDDAVMCAFATADDYYMEFASICGIDVAQMFENDSDEKFDEELSDIDWDALLDDEEIDTEAKEKTTKNYASPNRTPSLLEKVLYDLI